MDPHSESEPHLMDASKRLAQQAFVVCENRIQLFLLEIQEERDQIVRAFWLSVGTAVFMMLTGIALTVLITVACWNRSPETAITALIILVLVYAGIAGFFFAQLNRLRRDWESFSATFNELRKDRECVDKHLS